MNKIKFVKISWNKLAKDSLLAIKKAKNKQIDFILSISRGGLVVSRIASDILAIPIEFITISSYQHTAHIRKPEILSKPNCQMRDKGILIVDEVSDSGDTLCKTLLYCRKFKPKKLYTLTPDIKPKTKLIPDFYTKEINGWIVFPYDTREVFESIMTSCGGDRGKSINKMKELRFTNLEIDTI